VEEPHEFVEFERRREDAVILDDYDLGVKARILEELGSDVHVDPVDFEGKDIDRLTCIVSAVP
jgi:hypothetical protein